MDEMKCVELEIAESLEVVPATTSSIYFISSCDSTAIGFKQDELCFSELFWSSESCETAIVSYKNCHNFKTKRF